MEKIKNFKEKLTSKQSVIGPFMKAIDPAFVEIAGYANFDFIILDMEHGSIDFVNLQNLIRATQSSNVIPIVRVQDDSEISIDRALDSGAIGVQIPQISNANQARKAVAAAKFAPEGNRGVCRYVKAAKYSSLDKFEYFRTANELFVILQLEGQEAIDNLDEILRVEGIDIIFVGPYDLSQSLGIPGEMDNPILHDKMKYIIEKAREKDIVVGTFVDDLENAFLWKGIGVQYISYSVDVGIFYEKCKDIVESFKKK